MFFLPFVWDLSMGAAQCEHIFQHRLLEQQGALLKGTLRKGEDGTSERRPRVSIHLPCWLTSSWDSNQKPSNHDFPQPLPQATVSLRGCVTRGSWKSAYGPEKKKKKVLTFRTAEKFKQVWAPVLSRPSGDYTPNEAGRTRGQAVLVMLLCTVWQQTDSRPAADGADRKQTSERWQSADLRPAGRRMNSCLSLLPERSCAGIDCVHTRPHTHTRSRTHLETWGRRVDLGCSDKNLSPPRTSLLQSAGLSATLCHWQLASQWCMCVCVCVYVCVCVCQCVCLLTNLLTCS